MRGFWDNIFLINKTDNFLTKPFSLYSLYVFHWRFPFNGLADRSDPNFVSVSMENLVKYLAKMDLIVNFI